MMECVVTIAATRQGCALRFVQIGFGRRTLTFKHVRYCEKRSEWRLGLAEIRKPNREIIRHLLER